MIEIEFADTRKSLCECCKNTATNLTRFVYEDGDAFAIYYAMFTDGHPEPLLYVAISCGEWQDDTPEYDRRAFALEIRSSDDEYQVTVVDADESPWKHIKLLGKILDREDALASPWIDTVFHITDHMLEEDPEVRAYFEGYETTNPVN